MSQQIAAQQVTETCPELIKSKPDPKSYAIKNEDRYATKG